MRFNELISGVRSDVGVKIFGDDMEVLRRSADEVAKVLGTVPGNDAVKVEQITGLPMLTVKFKRTAMARYGLNVAEVQEVIQAAIGGKESGALFEGDRRFPIVVRLPENLRTDIDALRRLPIALPRTESSDEGVRNAVVWIAPPSFRSARLPISMSNPGRTRSAARTASGAWSSPAIFAAATSAHLSPRRSKRCGTK